MQAERHPGEFDFTLQPSPIHGVGVFTTRRLVAGETLHIFAASDVSVRQTIPEPFDRYVFREDAPQIVAPEDCRRMSVGWFLNHSDNPNTKDTGNYVYVATRNIEKGEELTVGEYT